MYLFTLALHSVLRWAVVIAGIAAAGRAIRGRTSGRAWTSADDRAGRWFIIALDTQLLVGLLLYAVLSPLTGAAMSDMGAAMSDTALRYWAVEHVVGMLVALALAHVGRARVRDAASDRARHMVASLFFGLALLVVLVSIPWPGLSVGRPLLPGM